MSYKVTGITQRQGHIYTQAMAGNTPLIPSRFDHLEARARGVLSQEYFDCIAGAAMDENTMQLNRSRMDRWSIVPRFLKDMTTISTSTELLGQAHKFPFLIAPIASQDLAHKEAELATAKAAAMEDVAMIVSMQASHTMEEIASVMGQGRRWYQLYWSKSEAFNRSIIQRAEASGYSALVITLDTQFLGWRPRDLDNGFIPTILLSGMAQYINDPVFNQMLEDLPSSQASRDRPPITLAMLWNVLLMHYRYPGNFFHNLKNLRAVKAAKMFSALMSLPSLSWEDIVVLRKETKLPIILKGILHPEDAKLALKHGMDGIVVSNHGGRQLGSCIPTIDALPDVANEVKGKLPILFDSGIKHGDDIFKAIALGADAVLIGRPFMYALAIGGEAGVRELLQNMKAQFELTMSLSGCTSLSDITSDRLRRLD